LNSAEETVATANGIILIADALLLVKSINLAYLVLAKLKVEDINVLDDVAQATTSGNGNGAAHQRPVKHDLSSCLSVAIAYGTEALSLEMLVGALTNAADRAVSNWHD